MLICVNLGFFENLYFYVNNPYCYIIDCSENWMTSLKQIRDKNGECASGCNLNSKYKYEYNRKCVENCTKGLYLNEEYKCKCELDKCLYCPSAALSN